MLDWSWRSVVTTAVVLAAVFAAGGVVGFLLEHEPAPDERHISISRPPQPVPAETLTAGEVTLVGDGRIELQTLGGVDRTGPRPECDRRGTAPRNRLTLRPRRRGQPRR